MAKRKLSEEATTTAAASDTSIDLSTTAEDESSTSVEPEETSGSRNGAAKRIKTETVSLDFERFCESELIEVLERFTRKDGGVVAHAQVALLLNGLVHRDDRFTVWSPCHLSTLVGGVFSLLRSHPSYQPRVAIYEYLIELHGNSEPTTNIESIRQLEFHFEKSLKLLVKLARAASTNHHDLTQFRTALVNILERNTIYSIFNTTVCTLVVAMITVNPHDKDDDGKLLIDKILVDKFYQIVETSFEMHRMCHEQSWTRQCLERKIHSWRLVGNTIRLAHMSRYMSEQVAWSNLLELSDRLLVYTPTTTNTSPRHKFNTYIVEPRNVDESFSLLAASIQRDLLLNSPDGRLCVVLNLTQRVLDSHDDENHRSYYIDHLEALLNEPATVQAMYRVCVHSEINQFRSRLTDQLCSEESIDAILSSLDEIHAQRLIAAFRACFYYDDDKSNPLGITMQLKTCLIQRCNAIDATERVKTTACKCLMTLLLAVNKDPLEDRPEREEMGEGMDRDTLMTQSRALSVELIDFIRSMIIVPVGYSATNTMAESLNQQGRRLFRNPGVKSLIYQHMVSLCKYNPMLAGKVSWFFTGILDRFMIKIRSGGDNNNNDHALFDMAKCVLVDGTASISIIEPLDTLVHCALLCTYKDTSSSWIPLFLQAYLSPHKDANYIYTAYLNQWRDRIPLTNPLARTHTAVDFFDTHISQMILGLYHSALEFLIKNDRFSQVPDLIGKYELTKEMIQRELVNSDLAASEKNNKTAETPTARGGKKRKLEDITAAMMAKQDKCQDDENKDRENEEERLPKRRSTRLSSSTADKENQPPPSPSVAKRRVGRPPLQNITNTAAVNVSTRARPSNASTSSSSSSNARHVKQSKPPAPTTQVGQSKSVEQEAATTSSGPQQTSTRVAKPVKIRLSMSSCIKAIRLVTNAGKSVRFADAAAATTPVIETVTSCASDQSFINLILGCLEEKLNTLLENHKDEHIEIYNPECLNDDESLLDSLSDLWSVYAQRINCSNRSTSTIYRLDNEQFAHRFHLLNIRLLHQCGLIWSVAGQRFQVEQDLLGERTLPTNTSSDNRGSGGGGRFTPSEQLRKFVFHSLKLVKMYIKQPVRHQPVASKCCRNLLQLLSDIFSSIDFADRDYFSLSDQFLEMSRDIKKGGELKEIVIRIVMQVTSKISSPMIVLKHIAMNIRNEVTEVLSRRRNQSEAAYEDRVTNWIESYNLVMPFVINYVKEQLTTFDVMLNEKRECIYNRFKLFKTLASQLENVVDIYSHLRRTQTLSEELEQNSQRLINFDDALNSLSHQLTHLVKELCASQDIFKLIGGAENLYRLRELIETISSQTRVVMAAEKKRVRELIILK